MKLTWHAHAFFEVETRQGKKIVIDPFTENPLTNTRPEDLDPDLVLITHGHHDRIRTGSAGPTLQPRG